MGFLKRQKLRILLFLAVVGPGFITANVDNDADGIYTYSAAGAQFGYLLLWTMIPITISLIVVQEMSSRMGAVTGKGLSDLIREEFGFRVTFLMMIGMVVTNFGNVVGEFAGIASSLELFGISRYITVPLCAVIVWLIVVQGQYKSVEKIFLAASFFYVSYIVAGVLAKPEWMDALVATIKPPQRAMFHHQEYLYMVIGVVGTTIAPWMQFYLQASIVEKGVTQRQYEASQLDVIRLHFYRRSGLVHYRGLRGHALHAWPPQYRRCQRRGPGAAASGRRLRLPPFCRRIVQRFAVCGVHPADLDGLYRVRGTGLRVGRQQEIRRSAGLLLALHGADCRGRGRDSDSQFAAHQHSILSQVVNGAVLPFVLIFMLLLVNKKELMGRIRQLATV